MEEKSTQVRSPQQVEVVPPQGRNGDNGKVPPGEEVIFDISRYKKRLVDNFDRRFFSIFLATLVFNVILVLYISHIPFQATAEYIKKFQEHYASFVYKKQIEPEKAKRTTSEGRIGKEEKTQEKAAKPEEASPSGGGGKSEGKTGGSEASAKVSAAARRAAHTRSTQEIQREVSNKGILGLLTGTGSAARGEAVTDILSESGSETSKNLDEVLSGISGIKTSGTPGGKGGGASGARGGRATGSGTGIGDMIDDLTTVRTQNFAKKTEKMVVSESRIKAESGKSAGRDPASVMAVVNSHRAAIEYCYQRALRRNPNLKGKISLRFVISPAGQVKKVEIISNTLNDSSVERCIIAKIRSWRDFGPIDPAKGDAVFRQDYVFGY